MTTAAGSAFGSLLIAKPNSMSWISGTPSIIAKVMRSRRIWMNSLARSARRRRSDKGEVMPCCPCKSAMNWMKTSSRLVSAGATLTPGATATSASAASSAPASRPTTCSDIPKAATWSTPGMSRRLRAIASRPGPVTTRVVRPASATTSATVPSAISRP